MAAKTVKRKLNTFSGVTFMPAIPEKDFEYLWAYPGALNPDQFEYWFDENKKPKTIISVLTIMQVTRLKVYPSGPVTIL